MSTFTPEDATTQDWRNQRVRPLYCGVSKGKIAFATPVAGRMSLLEWSHAETDEGPPCTSSPHDVIRRLIVGRIFPGSFYHSLGEKDLLSVMSTAEIYEGVGAASPTPLQLEICGAVMREHVGEPKMIWGHERWLVAFRFNDNELDADLAKAFPIPENERYAGVHPLLQFAGTAKRKIKLVSLANARVMNHEMGRLEEIGKS